ncbi:hypothetical protein EOL73_01450 [Candidatus Saccharibacteria bacterium]|nr:hypothetical protein [Candidatus Saccharibacteria bacterium]NCU40401.1 hypothetical protein [Candidatus Saccharibacteria bacterium]
MIEQLLKQYPLVSDQVDKKELRLVLQALERALENTSLGEIVEFGCYAGTTSLFISRILQAQKVPRQFHVYDSFEGLPEKRVEDQSSVGEMFRPGELSVSKKQFIQNYKKAGLLLPQIHKGWFENFSADDVPKKIALAFLDGDYYNSIKKSLCLIESRLVPGAIIVVDDYTSEALPGVARAVDEWLLTYPHKIRVEYSLAIIS